MFVYNLQILTIHGKQSLLNNLKRWKENSPVQWKFHLAEVRISMRIVQAGTAYQPLTYSVLYQSGLVLKTCKDEMLYLIYYFATRWYLSINMEKTSANLVREASLDRRLSIALPDIGLFFPVKIQECGIYEHLHMNIANSLS